MKRYLILSGIALIQLLLFYVLPLFAGPADTMGLVVLLLIGTFVLSLAAGTLRMNFKYLYPAFAALAFVPSAFIHYNSSALIHALWYLIDAALGLLWGMLIGFVWSKAREG